MNNKISKIEEKKNTQRKRTTVEEGLFISLYNYARTFFNRKNILRLAFNENLL